jgi:hypothetical protein
MTINDALELLKFYDGPFELTLHSGASEVLINKVEDNYGIKLPDDFKTLYRFTDGFEIDEDIFNIIPLEEMIGNKEVDEPIWIAEYMIYSDMWSLEINPEDPNDYSISTNDWDRGKIVLTNSLAEFIERALKGAVFEKGGLHHWMDEIKARTYGNTKPNDMKQLLASFCECLKLDLISPEYVTRWADWIISTEVEPDHFFIEISLSQDLNGLLIVLNSINLTEDILQIRVVFAEVCVKFLLDKMTADNAILILGKFVHRKEFTPYEINEIRYLIEEWEYLAKRPDKKTQEKLNDRIKVFFDNYSKFNLYNCKNWNDINTKIIEDFSSKNSNHIHRDPVAP